MLKLGSRRRQRKLEEMVRSVPLWWHSIDLGNGVVTPGQKSPTDHEAELQALGLTKLDLGGKSVIDIGGWDGYYAFYAERQEASRVAVLDHYTWALDIPGIMEYWRTCKEENTVPDAYHTTKHWHPDTLPGKAGFDVAKKALNSSVEEMVLDLMDCDLKQVGTWDISLYIGVLYHMQDPLRALKRLATITKELAVVETEAIVIPGYEHEAMWRFFPSNELNNDVSNWWAPNLKALEGALLAAGFREVEVTTGPPTQLLEEIEGIHHYRASVHALK